MNNLDNNPTTMPTDNGATQPVQAEGEMHIESAATPSNQFQQDYYVNHDKQQKFNEQILQALQDLKTSYAASAPSVEEQIPTTPEPLISPPPAQPEPAVLSQQQQQQSVQNPMEHPDVKQAFDKMAKMMEKQGKENSDLREQIKSQELKESRSKLVEELTVLAKQRGVDDDMQDIFVEQVMKNYNPEEKRLSFLGEGGTERRSPTKPSEKMSVDEYMNEMINSREHYTLKTKLAKKEQQALKNNLNSYGNPNDSYNNSESFLDKKGHFDIQKFGQAIDASVKSRY